ncbi:MAG: cytochrome c3 family protein [Candidatus Tectomicrobia bacterium]|nr:cytochrome c3 family protein [Candidatus Tectomicrobia bacterium]
MKKEMIRPIALWILVSGAAALFVVGSGAAQTPAGKPDSCVQCHRILGPKLGGPVEKLKQDIHAEKGLSCASCHGGDPTSMSPTVSMSKEKGFVRAPKTGEVPRFCNRCHGDLAYMRPFNPTMPVDQFQAYQTSVHGKRLAQGDVKVATCISCHGAHGILPASRAASPIYPINVAKTCAKCHADKEYMREYQIPTNQLEEYSQSVHAELLLVKRDLSAPTCNDCHGNHGAFPPAVESVSGVCGQCHVNNRDYFVKSPHKKAFDDLGLPECAVCHFNHRILRANDEMVGGQPPALCARCHDPGFKGIQTGTEMRARIEALKSAMKRADEELDKAERAGMEVSEAKLQMKETRAALIGARTKIHTFSIAEVEKEAAKGMKISQAGFDAGVAALKEWRDRRRWVIFPILLTLFVAGALYLKLRRIEGRNSRNR